MKNKSLLYILIPALAISAVEITVSNTQELVDAVENAEESTVITLSAGTYAISRALKPKANMTFKGAGIDNTVIKPSVNMKFDTTGLPKTNNPEAYLFSMFKVNGVTISDLSLTGTGIKPSEPALHGLIYSERCERLTVKNSHLSEGLWKGIFTLGNKSLKIHDNTFVNAGGKVRFGGAAIWIQWLKGGEIWNNRMIQTEDNFSNHMGIKGLGGNDFRIHHNTIRVKSFSIELPFEVSRNVEIDHNAFNHCISIPRAGGGPSTPLEEEYSFHIHHNWFTKTYSLEYTRNSVIVENNFFDFSTDDDRGNLISSFGKTAAPGPTIFRNNLIKNPGRGIFWAAGPYNNFSFCNNHVKANTTTRKDGFFSWPASTDFASIVIKDNIFENTSAMPRPLLRNDESRQGVTIENNTLVNISDAQEYTNTQTGNIKGLKQTLTFNAGVDGEFLIDGWEVSEIDTDIIQTRHRTHTGVSYRLSEHNSAYQYNLTGRAIARRSNISNGILLKKNQNRMKLHIIR